MNRSSLGVLSLVALLSSVAPAADAKVTVRAVAVSESRGKALVEEEAKNGVSGPAQITTLRVTLELAGDAIPGATQYGGLTFKATDDKGNVIKPLENPFAPKGKTFAALDRTLMWLGRDDAPTDRIRLDLQMEASRREASKIATLDGSVKLLTGTPVDVLVTEPEKTVNKQLTNHELVAAGLKVTLTTFNAKGGVVGSYVKAKVSGKLEAMGKIDVVDASGKSLSQGSGISHGFAGGPSTYEVFGDAPLPAGAKVKIMILSDVKEIEVPFQLKDIVLP